MQLSKEHAKLIDELLDSIDVEPWNVGLQEKIERARESLFAQADAQPVADVWQETDENGMPVWNECSFGTSGNDFDFARPLYTHPEASAQPMCVKCGDGIMAHDPGTCGNCHAMGAEASAPGLSDEQVEALCLQYGLMHLHEVRGKRLTFASELSRTEMRDAIRALLTRASAATVAEPSNVTVLPDGSAFSVASMPLPKDHWLYAERTYEKGGEDPDELPAPVLTHAERDAVVAAIRYAVRGATMCGKESDFDPDALVQNAVYALCGSFTRALSMGERIGHATEQAAQQQAEPGADERAAFEAWALKTGDGNCCQEDLQRWGDGDGDLAGQYVNALVERDWLVWQARAAQSGQRAGVAEGWQPIETAPKTGRTLLLGYPNSLGNWRTTRGQWMSDEYIAEYWEEPDNGEAGWFETSVEADDVPNCWRIAPTHWMPLPAAPTQQQEGL